MLTQQGCQSRQQRLWDAVSAETEWLLVADPRHVLYLSNFLVNPLSFSGGERGILLLRRGGATTLIADNFSRRSSVSEPFVDDVVEYAWYDHKKSVINRDHALFEALDDAMSTVGDGPGLVEGEWLPIGTVPIFDGDTNCAVDEEADQGTPFSDIGTALRHLRRSKEADELDIMRRCMRGGEAGQAKLREILKPGITELEIYLEVQHAALTAAGCPGLVYGDFRATNPTKPKVGGAPTDYALSQGDLFILDYSVVISGYRSDFTNTLSVGPPSAEVETMFALCQTAMARAEATLKAGAQAKDVHAAAHSPFVEAGRPELFTHHAGHGLGLAHPEAPILTPESTDVLVAGDVVTIEPGAYQAGIGGMRIEHNYLITETGYERLSNHKISLT
ncbi:MAG: Xaa-Pro peptidase family protein [Planctomycetaceae bacterium]